MLRKKFKKILAISMAFSMIFCTNAFATPIDVIDSVEKVTTDTLNKVEGTDYYANEENEWLNGTINEEVRVTVDIESLFDITIPKDVVLDGETKKADYKVSVKGDIAGDQKITVTPDETFDMKEKGGKNAIIATVTQDDKEFVYNEINESGKTVDGLIEANNLTAGEWSGKFVFNINFEGGGSTSIPEAGQSLEAYSWDEIAAISEAGLAQDYFNIGDEKRITLNSTSTTGVNALAYEGETYTLQIIGFNHDDLADGSGKAGITFQFKECIGTYYMNSSNSNIGGWRDSAMRKYINNTIYNTIPNKLKKYIKDVNKKSTLGYNQSSIIETTDKLFLLGSSEVSNGWGSNFNHGERYAFYPNDNVYSETRDKQYNGSSINWWLRESGWFYNDNFALCGKGVLINSVSASNEYGVAPAFCI